ncbi:MAG: glycosyltransferase [Bacteroidetes bacterium]|nr:glycosyltransferase [Bacteroidota bacterium]
MGNKLKIVIVGSAYPYRGGLAAFNERIAQAYIQQDHEVEIETFTLQYPSFLFPGKTQFSSEPEPDNLKIERSVNSINPISWYKVGRKIRNKNPDIVIMKFWIPFMAPCFGTIAKVIKKDKKIKLISIIDNVIPHEKHIGDRWLATYFVKYIDGFIAMSKSVLAELKTFDTIKPKLFFPHPLYDQFGTSISKMQASKNLFLDEKFNYLLFFGFIRDYKGLDLALKAMSDKRIKKLPIKLIVAGEYYTNSKPYEDLIEELDIKDHLILVNDFIPDSKVVDYFCIADIIVQPYKSATQSGVTQIAYHFEKPMIVTDVGGLSEIVPHEKVGYIVGQNPIEIADSILRFYQEKKEKEFIINIKEEKKKYSWEGMLKAIDQLIEIKKDDC